MEFLPYWTECLSARSVVGESMRQFSVLYTACTDHLPDVELQNLYRDVTAQDDSPECYINTSMIISRTEAKQQQIRPPCDHDTFSICGPMLGAGLKTCEADYCGSPSSRA